MNITRPICYLPHDVPPLLCFNVQTKRIFWVEKLLFPDGRRCKNELFYHTHRYTNYRFYGIGTSKVNIVNVSILGLHANRFLVWCRIIALIIMLKVSITSHCNKGNMHYHVPLLLCPIMWARLQFTTSMCTLFNPCPLEWWNLLDQYYQDYFMIYRWWWRQR